MSQFNDHVHFFGELKKRGATAIVDRLLPIISLLTPYQKREIFIKSWKVAERENDTVLKLVACTIGYAIRLQENIERDSLEREIRQILEDPVEKYLSFVGASANTGKTKNLVFSAIFHPPFHSYGELPIGENRGTAFLNTLNAINKDFMRFLRRSHTSLQIINKISLLYDNLENQQLHNLLEREHWKIFEGILDEICPPSKGDFFKQPGYRKYINPPLGKKLGYLLKTFKQSPLVREMVTLAIGNVVEKNYKISKQKWKGILRSGLIDKLELRRVKHKATI